MKSLNFNKTKIKIIALKICVNFVVDPFLIAATLLIVAAAPFIEPVNAQKIFPKPCIKTRFFELCFVLVNESTIIPVKRLSLEDIKANVNANVSVVDIRLKEMFGICSIGKLNETEDIFSIFKFNIDEIRVIKTRAINCEGRNLVIILGIKNKMIKVDIPNIVEFISIFEKI